MAYTTQNGEVGDAAFRNQTTNALAGNYVIDGCGVALGGSTTSIETSVAAGIVNFGNSIVEVASRTVTHPDGDADHPRIDAVTVNQNGTAGRVVGTPAAADPSDRRFPRVRTPTFPAVPDDNLLVVGALWVPAGAAASSGLFDDYVTPRELMGGGLNDLDLIPGRDLQYQLDNAREGETLRGDRSTEIVLGEPLTASTPGITIRNLNLRYADGVVQSNTDDMLTLAADNISVENVTLDGNKGGQSSGNIGDGITVEASGCTVENIRGANTTGYLVNLNGGTATVNDTTIRQVIGEDLDRDVIVAQGENTRRATIRNIRGLRTANGTVAVRNGATATRVQNIYGEDQGSVIRLQDFGPDNDSSASIVALFCNNIRADGTNVLVNNETTTDTNPPEVRHRGLMLQNLAGRNFSPATGTSIVDVSGWTGAKITNTFLSDDYSGGYAIYANYAKEVQITDATVSNDAPDRGCIGIFNSDMVSISNVICKGSPGNGIYIYGSNGGGHHFQVLNNVCDNMGESGVLMNDTGGDNVIDYIIVKNNMANVGDSTNGTNKIITDNMAGG